MDHSVDVRGGANPAGRHSTNKYRHSEDEESEFDEEDWEEGEEEGEEDWEESEDVDSEWDMEDVDVEEESDKQCSCSGVSLGKEGGSTDEMAEEHEEAIHEGDDDDSDSGHRAKKGEAETGLSVSTNSVAAASTSDSSSIFTAASPRDNLRVSAPTKGSVFGSLATTAAMSSSPQAPPMPLVCSAFPSAGTPPVLTPHPLLVTTESSIASCTAVQDQQQQNTIPAPPPTTTSTPATQQKQAVTMAPLHFVDFERSLGRKPSNSDGPRARSAAEEAQDVKRARQRYKLVLPTDKFDKQIEKALYGN